eukprot:374782-Rhodomonas_salina.1
MGNTFIKRHTTDNNWHHHKVNTTRKEHDTIPTEHHQQRERTSAGSEEIPHASHNHAGKYDADCCISGAMLFFCCSSNTRHGHRSLVLRHPQVGASFRTLSFCLSSSLSIPRSPALPSILTLHFGRQPSGMFFYEDQALLYILCGTQTNGEHYLYVYTTGGEQKCLITIPQAVGMSRVEGFSIEGSKAYIVDSQGPIYAAEAGKLGGSLYEVEWANPCVCSAGSTCTSTTASWSPTVTKTWSLAATDTSIGDGG